MARLVGVPFALLIWLSALGLWPQSLRADDEFADCKFIRSLPKTTAEMDRLHNESRINPCEPLGEGQPLETTDYSIIHTGRSSMEKNARPAMRFGVISVGLDMDAGDRADLPMTSRGTILDYLDKHYVSLQVRMRRDLISGKQYFHHRPIAATANFRGIKVTQAFQPLVTMALRDFRSVGLYSKAAPEERKPEDARTLVLIFRNTILKSGARTASQFEYAFIRGREGGKGDRLACHVFVTSKERTDLVYLNPYHRPSNANDCGIRGSVVITDFDKTGIIPKESATRSYRLDAYRNFPMANIEEYCTKNNLKGGFFENVDTVLDVLIDQKNSKK